MPKIMNKKNMVWLGLLIGCALLLIGFCSFLKMSLWLCATISILLGYFWNDIFKRIFANVKWVYYYEVGYGSYEDSHFTYLTHEKNLDLREEVKKVIPKAFEKMLEARMFYHKFSDLNNHIPEALVEDRGFKIIVPDQEFVCFGWHDILPSEAWKNDISENDELIYEAFREAGWTEEKIKEAIEKAKERDKRELEEMKEEEDEEI